MQTRLSRAHTQSDGALVAKPSRLDPDHVHRAFRDACIAGDADAARQALREGANPTWRCPDDPASTLGRTAYNGHRECCALLLNHGAHVDGAGAEAIDAAIVAGRITIAEWLTRELACVEGRANGRTSQPRSTEQTAANRERRASQVVQRKAQNAKEKEDRERRFRGERMANGMGAILEHEVELEALAMQDAAKREARLARYAQVRNMRTPRMASVWQAGSSAASSQYSPGCMAAASHCSRGEMSAR